MIQFILKITRGVLSIYNKRVITEIIKIMTTNISTELIVFNYIINHEE